MFLVYLVIGTLQMFFDDDDDDIWWLSRSEEVFLPASAASMTVMLCWQDS